MNVSEASSTPTESMDRGLFSSENNSETFLLLLVSQMKNQDPLNPQDPTQFVSQLAEFSSLEQLLQIRKSIDVVADAATAPPPAAAEETDS